MNKLEKKLKSLKEMKKNAKVKSRVLNSIFKRNCYKEDSKLKLKQREEVMLVLL